MHIWPTQSSRKLVSQAVTASTHRVLVQNNAECIPNLDLCHAQDTHSHPYIEQDPSASG